MILDQFFDGEILFWFHEILPSIHNDVNKHVQRRINLCIRPVLFSGINLNWSSRILNQ